MHYFLRLWKFCLVQDCEDMLHYHLEQGPQSLGSNTIWGVANIITIEIKYTINVVYLNHPETIFLFGLVQRSKSFHFFPEWSTTDAVKKKKLLWSNIFFLNYVHICMDFFPKSLFYPYSGSNTKPTSAAVTSSGANPPTILLHQVSWLFLATCINICI